MVYIIVRFLFLRALGVFFRRMEVDGLENIPQSGPVIFLPNHINALVDALVVLKYVQRPVSLTAKSTLSEYPLVGYLMRSAKVIRFYRKQDEKLGADRTRNERALAECRRRLNLGGALCIFPEGQSHSDPGIRSFRWGAARLALDFTESETPAEPLKLVPVGLHFPKKGRFRSDAWIRFGVPIDVEDWMRSNPGGGPGELTSEIEGRVRQLTLNFEQLEDSILLNWAADILRTGGMPPPRIGRQKESVAVRLSLVKLVKEGYDRIRKNRTREVEDLRVRVKQYRTELRRLGIVPAEVYIHMETWRALLFVIREFGVLLTGLPIAVWGTVNHFFPYHIVRFLARKLARQRDQVVTSVVAPGVVIFPLFYIVQISLAWFYLPVLWTAVYALSLPLSAYFTVRYRDRAGGTLQRIRAFMRFMREPDLQARLIAEGRSIIEDLQRLGEELEDSE